MTTRLARAITTLLVLALAVAVATGCTREEEPSRTVSPDTSTTTTSDDDDDGGGDIEPAMDEDDIEELPEDLRNVAGDASELGCEVSAPEELDPDHIDEEEFDEDDYSSDPPSSGPHFDYWANWGFYDDELHDGNAVHNLEHGGVVAWYGDDISESWLEDMREDLIDDKEKWVITPRDDFEGIASAAWGALLECDEDAVDAMERDDMMDLLDDWYDDVNSRGTEAEGSLAAIPVGSEIPEGLPKPERDISEDPLF